jgi:hypothetical protein
LCPSALEHARQLVGQRRLPCDVRPVDPDAPSALSPVGEPLDDLASLHVYGGLTTI